MESGELIGELKKMKKVCAYCNLSVEKQEVKEITKEHVFPNFFYERLGLKSSKESKFLSFNSTINQAKKIELFTKDVCNVCNNEKLSALDIHFKKIADTILDNEKNKLVIYFEYNLLLRWLLKTIFNAYRFVEFDATPEIYKNNYVNYILNNKTSKLPKTFIFGASLEKKNFSSSFMSIGRIIVPSNITQHLNILDFFQLRNFIFIIISFKTSEEYKMYHKKTFNYLNKNFHAKLINQSTKNFIFPHKSKHHLSTIFKANEEGITMSFKLFCKLQWNLHENTSFIFPKLTSKSTSKNYQKDSYINEQNTAGIINEISFILKKPISLPTKPILFIKKWKFEEYENVEEYDESYAKIKRYDNLTVIDIYDKNDISNPFIRDLQVKQNLERWNVFKKNISIQGDYIYIAYSQNDNILIQIHNSLKNFYFTSKVKVISIQEHN